MRSALMEGRSPMQSKLVVLLTVLSTAISTSVGVFLFAGPGYAIELALVSLLALVGWLRWPQPEPPGRRLVAPYILIIVCKLVLNTGRYWSGYAAFFSDHWPAFFAPGFRLTDTWWLALDVFGPVSLMLVGGYALASGRTLGVFMAWWAALYGVAEALLQYRVEFVGAGAYTHQYFLGALGAAALLAVGVITVQRLLGNQQAEEQDATPGGGLSDRQANLWMAFFATLIVVYTIQLFAQGGLLPVAVITASMTAGLIAWRLTTARRPADPHTFVPLYLLMLGLFYIHVGEELVAPFPFSQAIASLTGTPWSDADFTFMIILIGPIFWVFGAWSLWKRQPFGNFILWYMTIGMILGEPSHLLVFPVMAMNKFGIGYQYFAGMYTALFPMIPAILTLTTLLRSRRRAARLAVAPQA